MISKISVKSRPYEISFLRHENQPQSMKIAVLLVLETSGPWSLASLSWMLRTVYSGGMRAFRDARLPGMPGNVPACFLDGSLPFSSQISNMSPKPDPSVRPSPAPPWVKHSCYGPALATLSWDCLWSTGSNLVVFLYRASIYGLVAYSKVLKRPFTGVTVNCLGRETRK